MKTLQLSIIAVLMLSLASCAGKPLRSDVGEKFGDPLSIPRYVLVDTDGNIVINDAKRPSDGEALFAQIREALGR